MNQEGHLSILGKQCFILFHEYWCLICHIVACFFFISGSGFDVVEVRVDILNAGGSLNAFSSGIRFLSRWTFTSSFLYNSGF